ncbi:MAG: LysR family transcriptional regulator [Pseudomonadota bacterium]
MADINDVNIRLLDTTLLLVFLGIMKHGQATAVAREMGLTQPAVSHALKRLRTLYNDPLFLRRAHGLEPTAFARELEPMVRHIVDLISDTLTDQGAFDHTEIAVDLRIGAFDYEMTTIVPELVVALREANSKVNIHAFPLSNHEGLDALKSGQIDLAIGYFDFPAAFSDQFIADKLVTDKYVLVAREGHPLLAGEMSIADYAQAEHMLVSPFGARRTFVDHALRLHGYERVIKTTMPSLIGALSIVENSDLVVTLPERVARKNVSRFNCGFSPLPFDGGKFDLHAVRHARDGKSAVHLWTLDRVRSLVV